MNIYPEILMEIASSAVNRYLKLGEDMNVVLAKSANDLTAQQLMTVCQIANRAVHSALHKTSSFVEFPVADPDAVKKHLVQARVRSAVDSLDIPEPVAPSVAPVSSESVTAFNELPMPKAADAPEFKGGMCGTQAVAADDLVLALQSLDYQVDQFLSKCAGATPSEVLAAAAVCDGDHPVRFCTFFCSRKFAPADCMEVEKYAGVAESMDAGHPVCKAFDRYKHAAARLCVALPELEKQAILGRVLFGVAKLPFPSASGR